MTLAFTLLATQALLGAFDNLWHHEIGERLPSRPGARAEVALHAARELIYALVFAGLAWLRFEGAWAALLAALFAVEIAVTLADFVIEDRTRRLPRLERVLHTVLAVNFGAFLAVFAPQLLDWAGRPTALRPVDHGVWSWLFSAFALGVLAWGLRDLLAAVRLGVPEWKRRPMRLGVAAAPRTVLVTGATGFVGRALVRALLARGDRVVALSRDLDRARDRFGPLVECVGDLADVAADRRIDALVNLAGEPLAGGLWTAARRRRFVESRLAVTAALLALVRRLESRPAVLISGSAIGVYGDRGHAPLSEASEPGDDFMAMLCRQWEAAARGGEALGLRTVLLRTGFVLGRDGGALPPLALAARLGLATVLGTGAQQVSWIHIDDLVRLILFALDEPAVAGPLNAVAPEPATQRTFMRTLARTLRRPVLLRAPAGFLRAGLGELSALFLASQRVAPKRALAYGFRFRFATLAEAFAGLFAPPEAVEAALLNEQCAVCSVSLGHCRRLAEARKLDLRFLAVGDAPDRLAAHALTARDLRRRLYVIDRAGELRSGIDAVFAIWREQPGYRPAARLLAAPGLRQLAEVAYEGVLVPLLALRAERRPARRARHGRA